MHGLVFDLSEVRRESSALEVHVKPYIDASNTDNWKHVLRILYLKGAVLQAHENFKVPCLISQVGSVENVRESMDLLSGKSKTKIIPLMMNGARMFLPKLLEFVGQMDISASADSETLQLNDATVKTIVNIASELERKKEKLMGMIVEGAFTIADLFAVWFFKGLSEMRSTHILSGISENDYENMIHGLKRLDVIEPKLRVSVCPECMNYELNVSSHPSWKELCPKCGTNWTSQTLYMFKGVLGDITLEDGGLPIFISSYLKFRLNSQMLVGDVNIYPKAEVEYLAGSEKEKETSRVEIDVYIPDFHIGMECKTFEAPLSLMTTNRANGIVGDLMKQLRKYVKAGITDFFLVTNLPEKDLEKIKQSLMTSLTNAQIPLSKFEIIPGDVGTLLKFLDELADRIAKEMWKSFEKSLKKKLSKPIEAEIMETSNQNKDAT